MVALDLGGRNDVLDDAEVADGPFAKAALDAVIDRKVDGPGGEVSEDGGPEATVETADAVVDEDILDGA